MSLEAEIRRNFEEALDTYQSIQDAARAAKNPDDPETFGPVLAGQFELIEALFMACIRLAGAIDALA